MKENFGWNPENTEKLKQFSALALFIDDDQLDLPSWQQCLEQFKCKVVWLNTPQACRDFTHYQLPVVADKIQLVVADQFYNDLPGERSMSRPTYSLLFSLRERNPKSWIIETSYAPSASRYFHANTNGVINTTEIPLMQAEIDRVSQRLKNESMSVVCSYACNIDHLLADQAEKQEAIPNRLFTRMWEDRKVDVLLKLLGCKGFEFEKKFNSLSRDQQYAWLHCGFQILAHLNAGRDDMFYSMPLSRLKYFLKTD